MAKYEQYEEYTYSGVSWIPEIPKGWQVTKLKYLIKNLESGVSVNAADCPKSEGEFGVLKTSCVYTREFRAEENKTVFEEELSRVKCPVRAGSIIISRMNTPDLVGAAVYVKKDYSNLYLPDRLWQTVYNDEEIQSSKYLHYFMYLKGFRDQISNFAEGASSSMQSIAKEDFLSINILLPTRDEQERIANFLDHETAQIDTLIDKQQTLIQLLKEKRQAVISHAVTKGLNPDAPMKDSGVEWLGEVPEHWEVTKLGFHTSKIGSGKTPRGGAEVYQEEGVLFLRSQNVYNDSLRIDKSESVFISEVIHEEMSNTKVQGGDILLNVTGGSIGRTCIVPDNFIEANVNQHVCIVRLPTSMRYFVAFLLKSSLIKEQIDSIQTGGNREGLNFEQISKFIICLPPEKERKDIVDYIESETNKIDNLLEQANTAIQLMQERRTALISAAVTGKIDVRGWVEPNKYSKNDVE